MEFNSLDSKLGIDQINEVMEMDKINEVSEMRVRDIQNYIEDHYNEFPNFDGRSVAEILSDLPDQDERYEKGWEGLASILNDIAYEEGTEKP